MRYSFLFRAFVLPSLLVVCGCTRQHDRIQERPRNLIYLIGDGMGLAHVSMLKIENRFEPTAFDRMQNIALITSHSANNRVTDSAAAGTALASGEKTNNSVLGMTPDGRPLRSLLARAVERGMPTGIVVTSEVEHATPAAFYAHVPHRGDYATVAHQLAQSGIEVIFGGGRRAMEAPDPLHPDSLSPLDQLKAAGYHYTDTFAAVDTLHQIPLIGLFSADHLPSKSAGRDDYLKRATAKALELLDRAARDRKSGFVLMVEGSQIDFESHGNHTAGILAEMRDFEEAIAEAVRFVDAHPETLLVVTSDHETGGLAIPSGNSDFTTSESGVEYRYSTGSHTGVALPVWLYGAGAEQVNGWIDNTELARRLMSLLDLETQE